MLKYLKGSDMEELYDINFDIHGATLAELCDTFQSLKNRCNTAMSNGGRFSAVSPIPVPSSVSSGGHSNGTCSKANQVSGNTSNPR